MHTLYSNSLGPKARPHQLHPLLGCHRTLEKRRTYLRRWLLHLLSTESLFFTHHPPSLPPFCSHVLNRKIDVWKLHGHKNKMKIVWQRRTAAERFFFFSFHLHLVNTISAKSGWLSEYLYTYPSPNSALTRTYYRLTVLGVGSLFLWRWS